MDQMRLLPLINYFVIYLVLTFPLLFFQYFSSIDVYAQNDSANEENQTTNKSANGNNNASDIAPEQIAAAAAISGAIITGLFTLINQKKIASLDIKKRVMQEHPMNMHPRSTFMKNANQSCFNS